MKAIKLECYTRGAKPGDILPVGGKDEISLEDAQTLVAEKMAVEYSSPIIVDAEELPTDVKELRADVKDLKAEIKILKQENNTLRTERDEALTALALAKGETDGKAS